MNIQGISKEGIINEFVFQGLAATAVMTAGFISIDLFVPVAASIVVARIGYVVELLLKSQATELDQRNAVATR